MVKSPANRLLLTVEEAAECLSIGRTRMFGLIGRGEVESFLIGASRRIPVQALDDYITRQRPNPAA